jgi:N-acetyl-anhydromuramyl-L-alanine amidase AmpD
MGGMEWRGMFTIENHVLPQAIWKPTRHVGGRIVPRVIILHDTAGRLDKFNSRDYLCNNPSQVSCHFVVEVDGTVSQLARCDVRTNHAGKSAFQGVENVNGFSIGIEIVNPGRLNKQGVSWFGVRYAGALAASSPAHKAGYWLPYADAQITAVLALIAALRAAYPTISAVKGHHDISPGRKEDPTPLFPWARIGRTTTPPALAVNEPRLQAAQARLDDLGYYHGILDGKPGVRTKAAVYGFQSENGLAETGELDAPTVAAMEAEDARPIPTGHREEVTERELAASGVVEVRAARADRAEGSAQAAMAVVVGFLASIKATAETVGVSLTILAVCGVAAYLGIRQLRRGNALAAKSMWDFITGRRSP